MNDLSHLIHLVKFMEEVISDRDAQIKYLIAEREQQAVRYNTLFKDYKNLLIGSDEGPKELPF